MKLTGKIPSHIRYALWVFLLLVGINLFLRFLFLAYNFSQASAQPWEYLLVGFGVGFRFDLATIFIFNGLLLLLLLLPVRSLRNEKFYGVINFSLLLLNFPVIALNSVDIVYFGFSEKRLTHEIFSIAPHDVFVTGKSGLIDFWWILILIIMLMALMIKIFKGLKKEGLEASPNADNSALWWIAPLLAAGLFFLGIRGGMQKLPLRPSMAFTTPSHFVGNLGLNSAYTVLSSFFLDKDQKVTMLPDAEANGIMQSMVENDFDQEWGPENYPLLRRAEFEGPEKRYNVVIMIIESFDADHTGIVRGERSITPFFDSLATQGRLFTRHYANANRSVESMPGILNSIPDIYPRPLIGSANENINHWGIGNMLLSRGYETSFYHGGRNGTMGFDSYTAISGLEKYRGMSEYPFPERDFDGHWGIFDGPFLNWWVDELNESKQPFCSVLFTLSNHHPFTLPEEGFEDLKASNKSPYRKTVIYTDRILRQTWKKISQMPWYDETVFVLTADHCFFEPEDPPRYIMDQSHVPLLILGPGISPGVDDRPVNHLNILPSLIEALRLDTWHASTGVSLLGDRDSYAITNQMGIYNLMRSDYSLSTDFHQNRPYHFWDGKHYVKEEDLEKMPKDRLQVLEKEVRAVYQVVRNARIDNAFIGRDYCRPPETVNNSEIQN